MNPPEPRATITEADIKEWLNARDAELRAIPGVHKEACVTVWIATLGEGKLHVMVSSPGSPNQSDKTFAKAKAKLLATITTPEQQAHKLRTEAQALIAKAVEIEANFR